MTFQKRDLKWLLKPNKRGVNNTRKPMICSKQINAKQSHASGKVCALTQVAENIGSLRYPKKEHIGEYERAP